MVDQTHDEFFDGRLRITQPGHGYRFSIDAVLLAATVTPKPGDNVLELGTGCGIIPLILASRYPDIQISAVEVQSDLAEVAQKNVTDNQLQDRIIVKYVDMRMLPVDEIRGPFDWVVSNPPYRCPRSGRINPNRQRALARHEIMMDLDTLLASVRRMLRTGGRFMAIYPAERLADLFARMREAGIEPKWFQAVHSRSGRDAKLVLVQGTMAGRPGLRMSAPLIVYRSDGTYTKAVQAMMRL